MNRILDAVLKRAVLLAIGAGLVGGCAATPMVTAMRDTQKVSIVFNGSCPNAVVPDTPIQIHRGDKVEWQAVDLAGKELDTANFNIYFDPFRGQPLQSNKGYRMSAPVDDNTPTNVTFKYTIVGLLCPDSPLDPFIKIL